MGMVGHLTEPRATSVGQLLAEGCARLVSLGGSARLDAEVLLAHALRLPRSMLIADGERRAEPDAASGFLALIARRLAGEPVAYLTGAREFWSLSLTVSPAVLIPRPETELVVERSLALLPQASSGSAAPRVLDLGTGSGAIALALATTRPGWSLTATDCSTEALAVARINAAQLGLSRVEFLPGDWFEPLAGRRFELICSNPPYVAADDAALAALRFEPATALTPGRSGLEALEQLITAAPGHLTSGGWLVLEHGSDQSRAVAAALVAAGYARVRCHRDLAGLDRVTEAQWRH